MPAGRPTDYHEGRPAELLGWMKMGFSRTASAGKMGVCKATLGNWMKEHPEFLAAVKQGEAERLAFWEEAAQAIRTGEGNRPPAIVIFALKNADREEWTDRQEIDQKTTLNISLGDHVKSL